MKEEERYEKYYLKLKAELEPGMKTNHGIFSHWEDKTAIFEDGRVGYHSLLFIQKERSQEEYLERVNRMLRANNLPTITL